MIARADDSLPRRHQETIRQLGREVDETLAGFLRGQGTVCLTLAVFYAVGLTLAGLDFGLTVGLIAGFLSFIPYLGSMIGLLLRSEEHTSELQSLMRISYAVFCLQKKTPHNSTL